MTDPKTKALLKAAAQSRSRLDEFDKTEWRDIARLLRPDWDDAQFEIAWQGFLELKKARAHN